MGKETVLRIAANLGLLMGSIVFSLLLCELALRLIGFSFPRFDEQNRLLGHKLHPGAEGWYSIEGGSHVKINSDGFRDVEHSKVKAPGTVRIAVLGDSYCEAMAVPLEETFWHVMEEKLNVSKPFGERKVEVLNFGVAGYGTAQELLMLENYVWEYSPDVVLLAFFPGNDLRNNSITLEPDKVRPFFVLRNGVLALDTSFVDAPTFNKWKHQLFGALREHWLSYHSRVHQLLALEKQALMERAIAGESTTLKGDELGVDHMYFIEPRTKEWKETWSVTEALILRIRTEVEAHGARFVLVNLSTGIQVHPDSLVRKEYEQRLGVEDLFYPDRRLKSLGEREHMEVLCLSPLLRAYAEKSHTVLHGFFADPRRSEGHYNVLGHRIAGEIIADYLCKHRIGS